LHYVANKFLVATPFSSPRLRILALNCCQFYDI
jgi:hypothetical protein